MRTPAVILLSFLAACSAPETPRSLPRDVPIFIISIDTLRADRLPVYGYDKGSTPNIDAFRREAILYARAFSNSPLTLPSHGSILTGTLPPSHGVRGNVGYRLTTATPTIASQLRPLGYATGAAVSTYALRRATGIHEGFDFYDDRVGGSVTQPTSAERDGEETRVALTSWLEGRTEKRLFGFLHLFEPHAPYVAPRRFRRTRDDYDNEISYADEVVGRFLRTLRNRGLYDDALIILLSDHGEGLGDHGEDEHGLFVYRESIQVPLLIKLPGNERGGETVTPPVGLNQLAEVVLSVAGKSEKTPALLDRDASPFAIYSETYMPRLHFGWSELRSLITGNRHLIDAPAPELYDYVRDPGEMRNRARGETQAVTELTKAARAVDTQFREPSAADPEEMRTVAAITTRGASQKTRRPADPKSKVQVVRDLRRATRFFESGNYRDAIPLAERVAFSEPEIVAGWTLLGRSRSAAGQPSLAIEAYREALKRFPESTDLALLLSAEYARAMNWDAAAKYAQSVLEQDPVTANEALAQIALQQGDDAAARRYADAAVRHAPGRIPTLMLLADLSRRAGRSAEQLMWLDRVEQEIAARALSPIETLSQQRGEALLSIGRIADAEAALRTEVARFPRNVQAWVALATLLGKHGRRDDARSVLRDALRFNDNTEMRALARQALEAAGDQEGLQLLSLH